VGVPPDRRVDLRNRRDTMKKILGAVVIAAALISGASFANAAWNDGRVHTNKSDGCTYQGYSCSEWQQQNGN